MRGVERFIRTERVCGAGLTGRVDDLSARHTGPDDTLIYPLLKGSPSPYAGCMRPERERIVYRYDRSSRAVLHGANSRVEPAPKV